MLKILGFVVSAVLAVGMTIYMIGAIHEHRSALPVVGVVFVALLGFGMFW